MAIDVLAEVVKQKGRPYQAARAHAAAALVKLALDAAMIDYIESRIERLEHQRVADD
jgi:hypothetical protein